MPQSATSMRSKLFHRPWKDKQERQAFQREKLSDAICGLKTVASIVNQVTDAVDAGPPGLKTGLTGLIYVLDAIQVSDHAHPEVVLDINDLDIENFPKSVECRKTIGEDPNIAGDA